MSSTIPEYEAQLTLRDRVNWPFLLANAIDTLFTTMRKEAFNREEIITIVDFLEGLIPSMFHDGTYQKYIKDNTVIERIDLRPRFKGRRMDETACIELGLPTYDKVEVVTPEVKFKALIDLLNRLGTITKKEYVEKFTGRRYKDAEELAEETTQPL